MFASKQVRNPENRLSDDMSHVIYCSFVCVWNTNAMRETHLVFSIVVVQYKSVQCNGEFEIIDHRTRLCREKVLHSLKETNVYRYSEHSMAVFLKIICLTLLCVVLNSNQPL